MALYLREGFLPVWQSCGAYCKAKGKQGLPAAADSRRGTFFQASDLHKGGRKGKWVYPFVVSADTNLISTDGSHLQFQNPAGKSCCLEPRHKYHTTHRGAECKPTGYEGTALDPKSRMLGFAAYLGLTLAQWQSMCLVVFQLLLDFTSHHPQTAWPMFGHDSNCSSTESGGRP